MANKKCITVTACLLLVSSWLPSILMDEVDKSLVQAFAENNERLGRAALCVADHFEDTETQNKTYKVIESRIEFMKQNKGRLTHENAVKIADQAISTVVNDLQAANEKCAKAGDSYTSANTPVVGADIKKIGNVFLKIGGSIHCLIGKNQHEQVPDFVRKAIEGLASDGATSLVDILYRHENTLAKNLASISPGC
ncbi:uncharacterized protein LOC142231735 [Haematobia irritans]|uniref:uncharacterized protein LOC142231735 n=1 Tax=Haematobia irritans TaxID=7368 RepID=UPI003F4FBC92